MTSQLKFKCPNVEENGDECGRRFSTQKELETHIKTRHPKLQISKVETKELKEEKEKKILDNLFSQINSLEKYAETQGENFHKQLDLPELPNYDDLIGLNDDYEEDEKEENINLSNEKNENEKLNNDNNENNENELNEINERPKSLINNKIISEKLYNGEEIRSNIKDNKIIEISEEMIFENQNTDNYDDIIEIDFSRKNIASFMNNRKVSFENLEELTKINLSYNWISYSYDLRFFRKLKIVELNDNVINEISFVESLPELEYLNVENNQINSITSLNQCPKLKVLKLHLNKLEYQNSTMRTLQNLINLNELTIKDNPFIDEMFQYKNLFIHKYKNLQILDNEKITDKEREQAEQFVIENNPIYKSTTNRPMSSRITIKNHNNLINQNNKSENNDLFEEENEEDDNNNNININYSQTQIGFKKNNNQFINNQNLNEPKKVIYDPNLNDVKSLQKQNKELFDIVNKQNEEIENLKNIIKTLKNNNKEDIEKIKLKEELTTLKKEYKDLLDKTMSTNNSTNKSNTITSQNYKNEEEDENIEDDDMDYDELLRKSYQDFAQINKELEKLKKETDNNQVINPMSNRPKININNNNKPKIMINSSSNTQLSNNNNNINNNKTILNNPNSPIKVHSEKLNPVVIKKDISNRPVIIKNPKNNPIILTNINKGNSGKVVINPKKK